MNRNGRLAELKSHSFWPQACLTVQEIGHRKSIEQKFSSDFSLRLSTDKNNICLSPISENQALSSRAALDFSMSRYFDQPDIKNHFKCLTTEEIHLRSFFIMFS